MKYNNEKSTKFGPNSPIKMKNRGITTREHEILTLLGFTNEQIARQLYITERTVKTHIRNIFEKFDETNRTRVQAIALKDGLLTLDEIVI